jgi:hypothetical protein
LEPALLAIVANRLCMSESKLGEWDRWLSTVYLPYCQDLKLRHMYEAMESISSKGFSRFVNLLAANASPAMAVTTVTGRTL